MSEADDPLANNLSLRFLRANGLTPDGNLERASILAEMMVTPEFPGRHHLHPGSFTPTDSPTP